jgi:hypothetical protein
MSYPPGGPGYPGAHQPSSGGYTPTAQPAKADAGPSKLPMYLLVAVAVLGLAAYLLSFGPVHEGDSGETASGPVMLGVIAMLFSGLLSVVALLPKQGKHAGIVAATAVVGFLLAIWDLVKLADYAKWALIVIVVVSALQTIAAITALLLDAGVISPPAPRPKYPPYQQQYGGGYGGPPGAQYPPSGPYGPPPATLQQPGAQGQQTGYPRHGGYSSGPSTGGFPGHGQPPQPSGPPTPPTGFPTYAQPPAQAAPSQGAAQGQPEDQGPTQSSQTVSTQHPPPEFDEGVTQQVRIPQQPDQSSPSGPPPS